jgi:hypothetical protein
VTIHLPILRRTERHHPRHRASDRNRELEHQLAGAEHLINGLRADRDRYRGLYDDLLPKAARVDAAETRATEAERRRDDEHDELVDLRARVANLDPFQRLAIGARDIDPGDAPTEPNLDVRAWRSQYATPLTSAITVMPLRFAPFAAAPDVVTPPPAARPSLLLRFEAGEQTVTVSGDHRGTA